ncbi:hypothetical protein SRB17_12340 [Streptomyces sp. RB17]|uniref:hypothetical protein n=1 Tax=Streptomyces sp. RB17 TaxID=2585197 RepID=UPI0012970878|nr:hypothetical protein [Streptomyces sp. RB17]MQY33273.1 hypothetical protein [Streptomyces sp. RB17]
MPRRTRRVRLWAACVALLAAGAAGCGQSTHDSATRASAPAPRPTVTVTATTTVTARPEPGPTVTRTKTVRTPGPTVTVTKAASGTVRSTGSGGTCSIVSNAGNCYSAGQFCRNSDHGATTTTAGGTPITCSYSGSSWRWTYA